MEPTWDLVLKRNPVERLKKEFAPLGIRAVLPELIAAGYENVAEEDIVRLQWWGLYHDKPKVGTFMLRIKLPSGQLTPAKLRAIGQLSNEFGQGSGELATRQNIQLHYLQLAALPEILDRLDAAGLSTAGGCGDTVRNITGCPVQGIASDELFDASSVVEAAAAFFYGNPDFADLPRKHKYSIAACADGCNAPEINCISLVGTVHEGREGFGVLVGGGLSSVPRIARDLGIFVPKEYAIEVLAAITTVWSEDLKYRVSRVKARLKFMVDDLGPDGIRDRVEAKLGRTLERYALPLRAIEPTNHIGIHAQKQAGLVYVGVPVHLGLISGDQMIAIADFAHVVDGDVRITRQQNFIVANVPTSEVDTLVAELARISLPLDAGELRANGIACTGEPHCNFSVTETKSRLGRLIEYLETEVGSVPDLRLQLDGCPHACGQHWVGDIGFQGTTVRDDEGKRQQAYDVFVRGGLGVGAAIGQPLFRRVPTEDLDGVVLGLVRGWLQRRREDERFPAFAQRLSDVELGALAGREPARKRVRDEAEAA